MNSCRLFAASDGFTVSTTWFETRLVTGTSSFIGSNGMRAPYTCGLLMNTFSVPCSSV